MVYCGKPSKGCQMCRTRRIKCDETKPTCNQCAKSRRQCPGYKDEFDLMFRNETEATERRAQRANRKALAKGAEREPELVSAGKRPSTTVTTKTGDRTAADTNRTTAPTGSSPSVSAVSPTLSMPVEQLASCHFVSNFVLIPRQKVTRGFNDHLLPLLRDEATNSPLHHAFNACALASLGNQPNAAASNLNAMAFGHYSKALTTTHYALADPGASQRDATLGSVLLLGLFENITSCKLGKFSWGSHTDGAVQLVRSRGRKQLRTKLGNNLFVAVRTLMIVHTTTTHTPPPMGVDWWINETVRDEHATRCQRLAIRVAELRAEGMRLMSTTSRSEPRAIDLILDLIRRAQLVDREVMAWMQDGSEDFQPYTVAWEDSHYSPPGGDWACAEVFPGRIDVYRDFWVASVWNSARICRLTLASTIIRGAAWVCSPVDYRTTPEYATSSRVAINTIADLIASVPYQLGWHLKHPEIIQRATLSGFACGSEDSVKSLPGYFLTWPLGVLIGQDFTTDAQRAWVVGRLNYIGKELGVRYACILTKLNARDPSMLIRRDAFANASPTATGKDIANFMSANPPPTAGYELNPDLGRSRNKRITLGEDSQATTQAQVLGGAGSGPQLKPGSGVMGAVSVTMGAPSEATMAPAEVRPDATLQPLATVVPTGQVQYGHGHGQQHEHKSYAPQEQQWVAQMQVR